MDGHGYSTVDVRIRAVEAVRNGMPVSHTAAAYGVDRSTLHRWLVRHDLHGEQGLQRRPVSGRPRKLPGVTAERLKHIVLAPASKFGFETDLWTVGRLHTVLVHHLNFDVSEDTVWRRLREAGLTVRDVRPRIFDAKNAETFANKIAPGLKALGIDPQNYAERAAPLQFVWRVRKQPRPPILNIVSNMLQPVGGVSHVRIVYPLQTLNTDPAVMTRVASGGEVSIPGGDSPRIYVLHRPTLIGDFGARWSVRIWFLHSVSLAWRPNVWHE